MAAPLLDPSHRPALRIFLQSGFVWQLCWRGRIEAMGSIVGSLATAALAAVAGLTRALVTVGLVLTAWGVVLMFRMPETGFQRHDASARARFRALLGEGFAASRQPGLRVLLIVTVVAGIASEAVDRLHVARLDQIGLQGSTLDPALMLGAASVLVSVGAIVLLFVLGSRLAGSRLAPVMAGLNVATGVAVVVLARVDLLAIALAAHIGQGMVRSVARTVSIGWTNHFTDRANRATVHSFVGQAQSLGEITGGITLGLLAQQGGIGAAIIASAGLYVVAVLWSARGRSQWSRPPATQAFG